MESASQQLAPVLRRLGQQMFRDGMASQGRSAHSDQIQPSMRCVPTAAGVYPKLLSGDWVAPNATVIGDVELGAGSSLWHSVVVRGDQAQVRIGKNTTVQDLTRIGSNRAQLNDAVHIGDNCYIGANVSLDACHIDDNSFVGMGASVGRGARIEAFGVLAAGAALPEGTTVPSGQIWAGAPAQYLRDISQEEKHLMSEHKMEMQQLSQIYSEETEKTFRQQLDSLDERIRYRRQDPMERLIDKLGDVGMPVSHDDFDHIEHRIYHDYVGAADFQMKDHSHEKDSHKKTWTPYEQDLTHYPEVLKQYQENYAAYDKIKAKFENENPLEEQGEDPYTKKLPKDMTPWEQKYDTLKPRYTGTVCQ